jgi:hypothetical protein
MKKTIFIIALLALISAGAAVKAGNPISSSRKATKSTVIESKRSNVYPPGWYHIQVIKNISRPVQHRPRDNNR